MANSCASQITFDSETCAIRPGGIEDINYSWLLNLAHQKSDNLKHLNKVTIEDGKFTVEDAVDTILLGLPGAENVVVEEDRHIFPQEWNYPVDIQIAFGDAGISLKVVTIGDVHMCVCANHCIEDCNCECGEDDGAGNKKEL